MLKKSPAHLEIWLLIATLGGLFWSGYAPYDRLTWVFETAPVWICIPLLLVTRNRFRFTPLVYTLIAVHCALLCVGGHYTYARVPLFDWLKDTLELSRNHFDRLGHIVQGFVPAMIAREIFIRHDIVPKPGWRRTLIVALCLAISALYELTEYLAALIYGGRADEFLATQGDMWDTQADMTLALVGAVSALAILSGYHDRQLAKRLAE